MTGLVLFSLDATLDVSRLYSEGIQRVASGLDPLRVREVLGNKQMDPLRALRELVGKEQAGRFYVDFLRRVQEGAYHCVLDGFHDVVRRAGECASTGIFYAFPQPPLEKVIKSSKLGVNTVQGYEGSPVPAILRAMHDTRSESVSFVLGGLTVLPDDVEEQIEASRVRQYRTSQLDMRVLPDLLKDE
ncbi:hypothetical protein HY489_02960 [Candidatus Woesearchaeota archaeon]|nr:hypothetical protein [Candidatus Woesearchaeota archaeon]